MSWKRPPPYFSRSVKLHMVSQCTTSTVGHIVKAVSAAQIIEIRNSCRPLDAVVDAEDFLPLPRHWKRGDVELFLLRVHGDSMEPEIHDGDLVAVRAQPAAESGELVVAVLKETHTRERPR